jgi:hypothetical protein
MSAQTISTVIKTTNIDGLIKDLHDKLPKHTALSHLQTNWNSSKPLYAF